MARVLLDRARTHFVVTTSAELGVRLLLAAPAGRRTVAVAG
jgi:hypothetical protein